MKYILLSMLWWVGVAPVTAATPRWQVAELGHVFEVGTAPALTLEIDADTVRWTVYDFWHAEVTAGRSPVTDGKADLKPNVTSPGYYLIQAIPQRGGEDLKSVYTSFAIVHAHTPMDAKSSPFGVMTHFAQGMSPAMLPVLKKIGIVSIRDEHYWAQVEKTRGVYQFPEKSAAYMAACKEHGIDPLVAMTFGNKLYDSEKGPTTPAGYAGYAKYGQAILDEYGPQIRWLEIWNEYNGTWCPDAAKKDRPKYYTEMLRAAYEQIKSTRPDVEVLGGAAVLIPLPYFEGIFKRGGLKYMDGVVIHPYRARPEGVDAEVRALKQLICQYNDGRDKPIWVTETGRHTREEYDWEAGRQMYEKGRAEAARYLVRQYTLLLKEDVAKIYWYLASDHASFVSMGLLRHHAKEASGMGELAVAPAYVAYATLIRHLDGATFVGREAYREYTRAHVYHFRRGDQSVRVCWATQPSKLRVKIDRPLKVVDLMGTERTIAPANGEVILELSENVIYLPGELGELSEVEGDSRVIASSLDDYTKTQGENNWYYGYLQDGDDTFRELKQVETMWGYNWGGVSKYLSISNDNLHPDKVGGKDAMPVVRWKSPVAGKLTVKGHLRRGGKGDGVGVSLRVDGREVFATNVGGPAPAKATLEQPIEVKQGSTVDLVVKPLKSTEYDATNYELTIIQSKS